MTKEKYFDFKVKIRESGLTPYAYLKEINIDPCIYYQARKRYDTAGDDIKITKITNNIFDEMNLDSGITSDENEYVSINGFEIKGNHNLIKEIIIDLLRGTQNV